MKPTVSEYLLRSIEERVEALIPRTNEDAAAWLDEGAPAVSEALRQFPEARERVIEAVRFILGKDDPTEWLGEIWTALELFPDAKAAVIAALRAGDVEEHGVAPVPSSPALEVPAEAPAETHTDQELEPAPLSDDEVWQREREKWFEAQRAKRSSSPGLDALSDIPAMPGDERENTL